MKKLKYLCLLIIMFIPIMVFADIVAPVGLTYNVKVTSDKAYLYIKEYYDEGNTDLELYDIKKINKTVKKGTSLDVSDEEYKIVDDNKKLFLEVNYKDNTYYILNDDVEVESYGTLEDSAYESDYTYYVLEGNPYLFEKPSLTSEKVIDSSISEGTTLKEEKGDSNFAKVRLENGVEGWIYISSDYMSPYDNTLIVRSNILNNKSIIYSDATYSSTSDLINWNNDKDYDGGILPLDLEKNSIVKPLYYYGNYAYIEYQDDYVWINTLNTAATISLDNARCLRNNKDIALYKYLGSDEESSVLSKDNSFTDLAYVYSEYYEEAYDYIYSDITGEYYWIKSDDLENTDENDGCLSVPLLEGMGQGEPVSNPVIKGVEVKSSEIIIQRILMAVCGIVLIVLFLLIIINRKKSDDDKKESLRQVKEEIEKTQSIPIVKDKKRYKKDK